MDMIDDDTSLRDRRLERARRGRPTRRLDLEGPFHNTIDDDVDDDTSLETIPRLGRESGEKPSSVAVSLEYRRSRR